MGKKESSGVLGEEAEEEQEVKEEEVEEER